MQKYHFDIRVHYPLDRGRMTLRNEPDWTTNLEAHEADADGQYSQFVLDSAAPYIYFKPVLQNGSGARWAVGDNYLAIGSSSDPVHVYPYFDPDETCSVCELREMTDPDSGRRHQYRIFYPPGYHENTLSHYPVIYMQDGQNLFFANEAYHGQHWRIAETLGLLDTMNATSQVMVVGIYPDEREHDYTKPGYEAYSRFVMETLKPHIDREYRTLADRSNTAVMGSSLGGVVSFYTAWQYPGLVGKTACMSSTFGWRDDLFQRVADEPTRPGVFYLDSGWPRDNYEVTAKMRNLMIQRGYRQGLDIHYFAFPQALHNEAHWAMRAHLPFQLFFGRAARTNNRRTEVQA